MKKIIISDRIKVFKITVILVFIVSLLIMRIFNSPFMSFSNGESTLDMKFYYNNIYAYKLLDTLGEQGRLLYTRILLIDFVFIISFTLLQNIIMKYVLGKELLKTELRKLIVIPYLRGLSDIVENILILFIINKHPLQLKDLVSISSFFTTIKFIFLAIWLVAITILIFVRVKNRKKRVHE